MSINAIFVGGPWDGKRTKISEAPEVVEVVKRMPVYWIENTEYAEIPTETWPTVLYRRIAYVPNVCATYGIYKD